MRSLTIILVGLLLLLQYPLWLGKGGWLRVWNTQQQLLQQQQTNAALATRNAAMDAEVQDLKLGLGAIEARARTELGMVRQDEVFFQILDAPPPAGAAVPPSLPPAAPGTAAAVPDHGSPR